MTIGQVARVTGVSTSAIRFYESSGILPRPPRKNGIRNYDAAVVERVKVLQFYRATGISIAALASMFSTDACSRRRDRYQTVQRRIAELDEAIEHAGVMKRRLGAVLACECDGDTRECVIFA